MRTTLILALGVLLAASAVRGDDVDFIDPMIGAITESDGFGGHGLGKTIPGATWPFGMVQLSPDTITGGGNNGPGYSYGHDSIEGFSFMHLSGTGYHGEFGNFLALPTTGPRLLNRDLARSAFSHGTEVAKAGYYAVTLDRYGVRTELAVAPRSGMMRLTYPSNEVRRLQVDLARRIGPKARWMKVSLQTAKLVGDSAVEGYMRCSDKDGGWGKGKGKVNYTLHYRAEFSRPVAAFGLWDGESPLDGQDGSGHNLGFFAEFAPGAEPILLKVGFSFVDTEGARGNLAVDIPDWDFDRVRERGRAAWADALDRVRVEGGTKRQRRIFATSLYRAFMDPREISDHDGRYRGSDGKVYANAGFAVRTVFSGWDVFRSAFPFYTLVRPDVVSDTINSMMRWTDLGPRRTLPVWDIFGCLSECMGGTPLVSVIADANRAGIRTFDLPHAYELVVKSVPPKSCVPGPDYHPGGLSATLDAAYYDWCAARLAESLGKAEDAAFYDARSQCYTNVWCAEVGWMRSRTKDGGWRKWEGRLVQGQGANQSSPYQGGWFVPHDVEGLIRLMGGKARFTDELEMFFAGTPSDFMWNDFYNHSNEPVHHVPYLFAWSDRPWLTQKWTRMICERAYGDDVRGLCGNEDVGQMSAWYMLSALGFHPVCPGSGKWILTSPLFPRARIRLDGRYARGTEFTVIAHGAEDEKNVYIDRVALNGRPLDRLWILTEEITAGGVLEFWLKDSAP